MERTGITRFFYNIWPAIYRLINGTFYFLIKTIKDTVVRMIAQVRQR